MRDFLVLRVALGLAWGLALFTSNTRGQSWVATEPSSWFEPSNWNGGFFPTQNHHPFISNGGTAQITQAGAISSGFSTARNGQASTGTLEISGAGVLSTFGTSESYVGHEGHGRLKILGGGKLNSYRVGLGPFTNTTSGVVTVDGDGSVWTNIQDIYVGRIGYGELSILNSGEVKSTFITFGLLAGSGGKGLVDNAKLTITNQIQVGQAGDGTLEIKNGSTVTSASGSISNSVSAPPSSVTVSGNSTWTNSSFLLVGRSGNGTLNIESGGTVQNVDAYMGMFAGARGTVNVSGFGSKWINTGLLSVGGNGNPGVGDTATLNVSNFGEVTVGTTVKVWNKGTIRVFEDGEMHIGVPNDHTMFSIGSPNAVKTMEIVGGGKLELDDVDEEDEDDDEGDVAVIDGLAGTKITVNGLGSQFRLPESIYVGNTSSGELKITGGGLVEPSGSGSTILIGAGLGSTAVVTVDGTAPGDPTKPSRLNGTGLIIGNEGDGILNITGKAVVNTKGAVLGFNAVLLGGGAVTVDDAQWFESTGISVGRLGDGDLNIINGGKVTVGQLSALGVSSVTIGSQFSGLPTRGVVTVDGDNSELKTFGHLTVADEGVGNLNVINGGQVNLGQVDAIGAVNLVIGKGKTIAPSQGIVTVDGIDSQLNVFGDMTVADNGVGTLHIKNGGYAENEEAIVGFAFGSKGMVIVDNSTWLSHEDLTVGLLGEGLLEIKGTTGIAATAGTLRIGPKGTLKGVGAVTSGVTMLVEGTVAPGASPGTLHVNGNYTQAATGRLQIEIASASSYDVLAVTGQASLGGTLEIILTDGFTPSPTQTFSFLTSASRTGTFDEVIVGTSSGGLGSFNLAFTPTGLTLSNYQPLPVLAGDFNGDSKVDAADYAMWRNGGNPTQGQYNLWRSNFGRTSGSGSGSLNEVAVPESTSALMLIAGGLLVSLACRKKHGNVSKFVFLHR